MADDQFVFDDEKHWYKDAVIYELHIKAFKDSNEDGMGDFNGLLEKLEYLEELGVTAIWLLPFYPSPLRDDGYDIADYYSINPSYGTIRNFKKFLNEAHKRNIKVITEMVVNHTSDQHPWFQRARRAKKGSVYRDYYVWSDNPNQYSETRIIFKDFEASNWTWDPIAKQYFWHRFYSHQPDLNFDNPRVQGEILKVIDYWFDLGVDGFRLDAVPYLFEREGTNCENLPETHTFLKKLRKHVDDNHENKMLLAEANMWPEDSASYFGNGDECHMNYHFPIMPRMFMSVKMEDRYPIIDIFEQTPEIAPNCQWAMFLRNHDELTLEMVTDEERDYMYKVYTKDPQAKINLGIRHRLAPLLDNDRKKIELMNYLLFSLPGTPVIYYGDEIGMGDNFYLGDRDGVRTPMQWSSDRNAGFSEANPQKLYLPVILDPEYQFDAVNVETQQKNLSSLFWFMKRVIAMRKRYKAFGRGDIKFLSPVNPKVLSFLRVYGDEIILVVANLSRFSQAAELDLDDYNDYYPEEVFSRNRFPTIKDNEPYLITLGPHGYYWFVLQHEDINEYEMEYFDKPLISVNTWKDLFTGKNLSKLENEILPKYIVSCRWFGGKARVIQKISVIHQLDISVKGLPINWLIIDVKYNEGLPEIYQLPLSFIDEDSAEDLNEGYRKGIIGPIAIKQQKGLLFDSVYSPEFQHVIFNNLAKRKKIKFNGNELAFPAMKEAIKKMGEEEDELESKVLNAEQSNTSIIFNGKHFLKLYRKLDKIINPDLEITRFLTEKTKFANVPHYEGSVEFNLTPSSSIVLGMMQELVPNQGDAWTYFKDAINRYFERVLAYSEHRHYPDLKGDIYNPIDFNSIDPELKELLGVANSERVSLLGTRTAEMHIALASAHNHKDFEPEASSLHYQRSLYSSLQSLVRTSYQSLDKNYKKLPDNLKEEADYILGIKKDVLSCLKEIYSRKISTQKIRNHGDYHLGQVLFTGRDFIIIDFEGEPARSFSERRLKRSPLRDVAGMVRSFHYAVYSALFQMEVKAGEQFDYLERWAEVWYHYMAGFFVRSYMDTTKGHNFLPDNSADFKTLMQTFLLEKAIYELNYELNNRPDWVIIPIKGIKYIMSKYEELQKES